MKISYDSTVDALYILLIEQPMECEGIRLNDQVAINIGPAGQIVGIEVLDASETLPDFKSRPVQLENLAPA